jgi:hypothetical protein
MPDDPKTQGLPTRQGNAGQAHRPTKGALAVGSESIISPEAIEERQRRTSLKRKAGGPINAMRSRGVSTAPPDVPETECDEPEEGASPTLLDDRVYEVKDGRKHHP